MALEARLRLVGINPKHARVSVFVGPHGHGANVGLLTLAREDWEQLGPKIIGETVAVSIEAIR